ncbi:unnamed protein product [Arctia plantaginis]|uniref:Uncharacterized protein n=1 Tax=Arctia plantaginis TaxID=874455 RepID=A0A8S1BP61_ARCPL|nr:unnamed protein product [Arctia plantaginis]
MALSQSKNLKTEVKEALIDVLGKLKKLVGDSEAEREVEKARKGSGGPGDGVPVNINTGAASAVFPDSGPSKILEEHSRLLLEHKEGMSALQEEMAKCTQAIEEQRRSYATVAASTPHKLMQPLRPAVTHSALHSVVVTSEDNQETADEVLNRVRRTVDAKEGWVKVDRVRKAKDQKVLMGFGTVEDKRKVKERLSRKGTGLVVEDVKNKNPLLVLIGVLTINTDKEVLRALRNQHMNLFDGLDPGEARLQVKYRRKARNPHVAHVVLSASPALWARITGVGSVYIDLQRVRAEDQSPLLQCPRCLGFGQGRKFCKEEMDLCSHCGGPHLKSRCPDVLAGLSSSCRNCRWAKFGQVEHNKFSDDCPVRRKWDGIARSSVAYC